MIKFAATLLIFFSMSQCLYASPIVPSKGSKVKVIRRKNTRVISGGIKKGRNNFLNFNRFDIPKNSTATFIKTPRVKNLFIAVKGNNKSKIFGKIEAQNNLYFINKNGFLIGSDNIFNFKNNIFFTTANKIRFNDASLLNSESLTIQHSSSDPKALIFENNKGKIQINNNGHDIVQQGTLTSPNIGAGRSINGLKQESGHISFSAGDIIFNGGLVTQKNGRIDLSAVKSGSIKTKEYTDKKDILFPGNVNLRNKSLIDSSGSNSEINILGNTINLTEESLLISLNDTSRRANSINIRSNDLNIVSQNIPIKESRLQTTRGIVSETALSKGADINIDSKNILLDKSSGIVAATFGEGDSGHININSNHLRVLGGSEFGLKDFGSVVVNATLRRGGDAGDINVDSSEIFLNKGGAIISIAFREGDAGEVNINSKALSIKGGIFDEEEEDFIPSVIASSNAGSGNGKRTFIASDTLLIKDGGRIDASTFQSGNSGDINIAANKILVEGREPNLGTSSSIQSASATLNGLISDLFEVESPPTGSAGSIIVKTKELNLDDGAFISVRSFGKGPSGSLNLSADSISLDNASSFTASTRDARGGNIGVDSKFLSLNQGSFIEANSKNQFGGRINLKIDTLFASPDSEITASSERGQKFDGTINATIQNSQIAPTTNISPYNQPRLNLSQLCGYQGTKISRQGSGGTDEVVLDSALLRAYDLKQRMISINQYKIRDPQTGEIKPFKRLLGVQDVGNGSGRLIFDPKDAPELQNLLLLLDRKCNGYS